MDISDDFPINKIYDAEEIIKKFDKVIKDIEFKKSLINRIDDNINKEFDKLDIIIKDIHDVKQLIKNTEFNITESLNKTNEHVDRSVQILLTKLEAKIDDIDIPKPSENIELLTFIGFTSGLSLGLLISLIFYKK